MLNETSLKTGLYSGVHDKRQTPGALNFSAHVAAVLETSQMTGNKLVTYKLPHSHKSMHYHQCVTVCKQNCIKLPGDASNDKHETDLLGNSMDMSDLYPLPALNPECFDTLFF